ncbi:hypothetical protein KHQ81_06340 [Mycoplasmatota bacterium]|nr:hypothetical protein KHQ81_06340 [Mycoplasmatota bacterium]
MMFETKSEEIMYNWLSKFFESLRLKEPIVTYEEILIAIKHDKEVSEYQDDYETIDSALDALKAMRIIEFTYNPDEYFMDTEFEICL